MSQKKQSIRCHHKGCNVVLSNAQTYKRHLLFHTDIRAYKCNVCSKAFVRTDYLKRHMISHSDERPFSCDYKGCFKAFKKKTTLNDHYMQVHADLEHRYKCHVCDKTFALRKNYIPHLRIHFNTVNKPHKCLICGVAFIRPSHLKKHILTHTGERPVACTAEGCKKRYMCVSHLNSHLRVHEKEKIETKEKQNNQDSKYSKCNICQQTFKSSEFLNQHILVHKSDNEQNTTAKSCLVRQEWSNEYENESVRSSNSEEHAIKCELCNNLSKTKRDYAIHQRFHVVQNLCKEMQIIDEKTSNITYQCKICLRFIETESKLVEHLFTKHFTEQFYDCNICNRVFIDENELNNHLKEHFDADNEDLKMPKRKLDKKPITINIKTESPNTVNQNYDEADLKKQLRQKLVVSIKRDKNVDKLAIKNKNLFKVKFKRQDKSPVKKQDNFVDFRVKNQSMVTIDSDENLIEKEILICKEFSIKLERINVLPLNDCKISAESTNNNIDQDENDMEIEFGNCIVSEDKMMQQEIVVEDIEDSNEVPIISEIKNKENTMVEEKQNSIVEAKIVNTDNETEIQNLNASNHEENLGGGIESNEITTEKLQEEQKNSLTTTENDYVEVLIIQNDIDGDDDAERESTSSNRDIKSDDDGEHSRNLNQLVNENDQTNTEHDVEVFTIRRKLKESLFESGHDVKVIENNEAKLQNSNQGIPEDSHSSVDKDVNPNSLSVAAEKDDTEIPVAKKNSPKKSNALNQMKIINPTITSQKFSDKFQELNAVNSNVHAIESSSTSVTMNNFNEFCRNLQTSADSASNNSQINTISNKTEIPTIDLLDDSSSDISNDVCPEENFENISKQECNNKFIVIDKSLNLNLSELDYKLEDKVKLLSHLKKNLQDLFGKLEELNIPISFEEIVFLPTVDYMFEISKYDFSEEQLKLIRAVRKRSRNPLNKKRKKLENENKMKFELQKHVHQQILHEQILPHQLINNITQAHLSNVQFQLPQSSNTSSFLDPTLNNSYPVTISFQHPQGDYDIRKEIPLPLPVSNNQDTHCPNLNWIQQPITNSILPSVTNFPLQQQNYEQIHNNMPTAATAATATAWNMPKTNFNDIERFAVFNTISDSSYDTDKNDDGSGVSKNFQDCCDLQNKIMTVVMNPQIPCNDAAKVYVVNGNLEINISSPK